MMATNQIAAIALSVLAIGAGAVGAAQVSGPLQLGPAELQQPGDEAEVEGDIDVSVDGNVAPGATVTLTATLHGEPVPHAPVEVDGERVGETDADGTIDVTVPDEDEFEVEIGPEYEGSTTVQLAEDEADDEVEEEAAETEDDDDDERRIDLAIDGDVAPNETVTVSATVDGTPLANAEISVNGEEAGTTDANGAIQVTVPEDADEFEVEATFDEEGELKVEFAEDEEDEAEAEDDELQVEVSGEVTPGGTVTVTAAHDGSAVENAAVTVNDETVGTTDADGQLDVTVPTDADGVEIEVETDDLEGEWEHEFEDEEADDGDGG